MAITFNASFHVSSTKNAMGIIVPKEVVEKLGGGGRPAVKVTLCNYEYRSTIARMGDDYLIPHNGEHRAATGLDGRTVVPVTLELDLEPRVPTIPEDLAAELESKGLLGAFQKLAPSRAKELVRQVEEAKAADTRTRRIAKVIASLEPEK